MLFDLRRLIDDLAATISHRDVPSLAVAFNFSRGAFGSSKRRRGVAGLAMEVGAVFGLHNLNAIRHGQNRWRLVAITCDKVVMPVLVQVPQVFSPLIGHSNNPNRKLWKFAASKAAWVSGGSILEAKRFLPGVVMRSLP